MLPLALTPGANRSVHFAALFSLGACYHRCSYKANEVGKKSDTKIFEKHRSAKDLKLVLGAQVMLISNTAGRKVRIGSFACMHNK